MSIEQSIISRAQPYVISTAATEVLEREASKGCMPNLTLHPVNLEPKYINSLRWMINNKEKENEDFEKFNRFQSMSEYLECWVDAEHVLQWSRAERFIKHLVGSSYPIGFEIIGNCKKIEIRFLIHPIDTTLLTTAFNGEYTKCELTISKETNLYNGNIYFCDFFPRPPYHHLFTRPNELVTSPYDSFIYFLAKIPEESQGFVQVMFEPVRHDWHQNVEILKDIEFLSKTITDPRSAYRIKQQLPSGDIRNMASEVESKAHNDKPFFSVALRAGIVTTKNIDDLRALTSFSNLFQHGGRPLQIITDGDYKNILTDEQIKEMFQRGLVYKPGFLLNSDELAGLIHIPNTEYFKEEGIPLNYLENKSKNIKKESVDEGIKIGFSSYAGKTTPVFINNILRKTSTHIIGRSGSGKSTQMENMIMQDIKSDQGVAVIDPHGDTIKRLLKLIPENKVDSTIYIDFGNSDWIPIWNPLQRIHGQDNGRTADNLVSSFKSIIKGNTWGDRLEHLLRNGIYGLLHLDNSTFYDLLILFEQNSKKSKQKIYLTKKILNSVQNEVSKRFWSNDFNGYRRDDFAPTHHKLSKLLNSDESISLMLTQPDNLIDFQKIMNNEKILLLDLSNISSDSRGILGSYLLSFLHNLLLARSKQKYSDRKSFNIYCDEAHIITTDRLEDMIIESRKFGVNLTLAHQYLSQFNNSQRDALLSVGTTIIFNVDLFDARFFTKDLQGKVDAKDIANLETGEAIARIGTEIVKIKTAPPIAIPQKNYMDKIITNSYENFYRKSELVRMQVKLRLLQFVGSSFTNNLADDFELPESQNYNFTYDEFE